MIEWRHLRSLTALRDTGSLTTAAEQLHLTQSALSHQLKELEDRLGARLFERKSRPVRFTLAGERLLNLADQVLPQVRAAERDLARLRTGHAGRLHLPSAGFICCTLPTIISNAKPHRKRKTTCW